jgi:hypothetical protein
MVGSQQAIGRIEVDPLMRALRIDKMTVAALEATLRLALDAEHAVDRIPLWTMITTPVALLASRAEKLAEDLRAELGLNSAVVPGESFIGGGSVPIHPIPTAVVAVSPPFPSPYDSEAVWARALRRGEPAVVPRVQKGLVLFDLRTVPQDQEPGLFGAIRRVCRDRERPSRPSGIGPDRPGTSGSRRRIASMNGPEGPVEIRSVEMRSRSGYDEMVLTGFCGYHVILTRQRRRTAIQRCRVALPSTEHPMTCRRRTDLVRIARELYAWVEQLHESDRGELMILVADVRLLVPIANPPKLLFLAGNYAKHVAERGGTAAEREETFPYVFLKPPSTTLTRPGDPILIPRVSPDHIDWARLVS